MSFVLSFLVFSTSVFAISPSHICQNVASKSVGEALRCNELISEDHFFDSTALFGCYHMSDWTAKGAVDCMAVIADKVYPNQSAKTCVELAHYNFKAIECFQKAGRPYKSPDTCQNAQELLALIHSAKDSLLKNNYQLTYQKLTNMEQAILNCSREQ